jgi:CHRD domain/PEP-CTERM motif
MRKTLFTLAALSAIACAPAHAAIDNYFAALLGANEVVPGDPDGFGSALVAIDNVANTVSWSILALNIAPVTLAHIHQAPAGVNGPVKVDFNAMLTGSNLFDVDLGLITPATASGFYVNVHTGQFPGGAIRGQLQYVGTVSAPIPEPETYALMLAGLGVVGFMARRRARAA